MERKFYKCFNADLTNRYGFQYEIGKDYKKDNLQFGNDGHGFHVCSEMVDTFRFFDTDNCAVAEVTCWGNYQEVDDEYYGYYGMYAFENMRIDRIIPREEIIERMLNHPNSMTVQRFIQTFHLRPEEIKLFFEKFSNDLNILKYIAYYQLKDINAFALGNGKEQIGEVYDKWTRSL